MDVAALIGAFLVAVSAFIVVAGTWMTVRTGRRRAIQGSRARVSARLDMLAAEICDALAAGDERRHATLVGRYEGLSESLASARGVREVHRVELRASADAARWRVTDAVTTRVADAGARAEASAVGRTAREATGAARAWWALARSATDREVRWEGVDRPRPGSK